MRSRKIIEDSFKDILIPSGRGDIRLQIELLLDIRELMENLVGFERGRIEIEKIRQARERAEAERIRRTNERPS